MNIIKNICTKSDCYKTGKKIKVKGLMLHSVGYPQPKAKPFITTWNKAGVNICVHAVVEPNGDVYQLLPWEHRGWHAGGKSNDTHIGIELTEPNTIKYISGAKWQELADGTNTKAHILATYKHAVELFAHLCTQFDLNPLADGVIISHSEGHKRKIASNHADVEHLWSKFGLSMAQFRQDVKNAMQPQDEKTSSVPYLVRVSLKDVNIRKGPGTNYARVQYIPTGVYTIVEEANGKGATKWGKLKSGAGWISLDFAKKV